MPPKRKHVSTPSQSSNHHSKRLQADPTGGLGTADNGSHSKYGDVSAPIDQDSGQRGAFPELDGCTDEDLFYAPAGDGIEYIRMVRSEAQTVPKLLTTAAAHSPDMAQPAPKTGEGYYEDGAYVACPTVDALGEGSYESDSDFDSDDVQASYYAALRVRFAAFRAHARQAPPSTPASPMQLPLVLCKKAKAGQWSYGIRRTAPKLRELAGATQDDVVRGLARIEIVLTARVVLDEEEGGNVGCWAWALLGRCWDVGAMHSDAVATVRALGKRALAVAYTVRRRREFGSREKEIEEEKGQGMEEQEDSEVVEGAENLPDGDEAESLLRKKAEMLAKLNSGAADNLGEGEAQDPAKGQAEAISRALGLLDIIVTVVGDAFGQRDLLDARTAW